MDTISAVRNIRVVRAYRPEPLTAEEVRSIADAGRKAGSSKNTQRWDFITIRDPERLAQLPQVGRYGRHLADAGAAIALIVAKPDPEYPRSVLWDLGRAAQNMVLTAWAMGIGSCPVTVHHFASASRILGLPPDRRCEYVIGLGWPADPEDLARPSRAGGRRRYEDVVHDEQW